MSGFPLVVLVNSLAEFEREVPPPQTVRLNLTERRVQDTAVVPIKQVQLHLQGVSAAGEIVWLFDYVHLQCVPGRTDEFMTAREESLYGAMPTYRNLIEDYLLARGYDVRRGEYAIPDSLKPVRGQFECVEWEEDEERYTVRVANGEGQQE